MSKTLFVSEVYSRCGELIKALESNYNGRYDFYYCREQVCQGYKQK